LGELVARHAAEGGQRKFAGFEEFLCLEHDPRPSPAFNELGVNFRIG
jgi:hypothetical protein